MSHRQHLSPETVDRVAALLQRTPTDWPALSAIFAEQGIPLGETGLPPARVLRALRRKVKAKEAANFQEQAERAVAAGGELVETETAPIGGRLVPVQIRTRFITVPVFRNARDRGHE